MQVSNSSVARPWKLKQNTFVGDFSKAHTRFLHELSECGLLACRVKNDDPFIFINRVGTFSVASASYWWGRIAASGIRLTYELLHQSGLLRC